LLVDLDTEQPGPAGGEPDLPGHHPVPLPLFVVGGDLACDEGADHVAERVVLRGEDVTLHRRALPAVWQPAAAAGGPARPVRPAFLPVSCDRNIAVPASRICTGLSGEADRQMQNCRYCK